MRRCSVRLQTVMMTVFSETLKASKMQQHPSYFRHLIHCPSPDRVTRKEVEIGKPWWHLLSATRRKSSMLSLIQVWLCKYSSELTYFRLCSEHDYDSKKRRDKETRRVLRMRQIPDDYYRLCGTASLLDSILLHAWISSFKETILRNCLREPLCVQYQR